ncbi:MAG: ABC transporter permease [Lachnospiraceae bacterium]
MTLPFENDNAQITKQLARNALKTRRKQNMVIISAVFLTTILISFVWTAGLSFISSMHEASEVAPGPGSDGAIVGDEIIYEKVSRAGQVEWADYVRKCSTASLHNDSFAGIQTELLAPDKGFYAHNDIVLQEGTFPEAETEILISDTLAQKTGISGLGTETFVQAVVFRNEAEIETKIPVKVCGVYKNPLANLSGTYEEIYTSAAFILKYNPELPESRNLIYVKLNNLNPFLLKSDIYNKLSELCEHVGGEAVQTKNSMAFSASLIILLPLLLFILLIMASGYFLIHNVFDIFIASDIRWIGMMKTIGATKRQLKTIYMRQIYVLAAVGITLGLAVGYGVGLLLAPEIMKMTDYSQYYKATNVPLVLLFTVLFSWLTVWISCFRTLKKAAACSPIEAANYTPRRKNKVLTVLSFALSGIIFLVVCNVTLGYRVSRMIDRYNQEDVRIVHKAAIWELTEPYKPISAGLPNEIKKLPFVEKVDVIYRAKTFPDQMEWGSVKMYEDFLAEVKLEGKLKQEAEAIHAAQGENQFVQFLPNGNIKLKIGTLPAGRLNKEKAYIRILDGKLDEEKFMTGNYILYQDQDYLNTTDSLIDENQKIHAGDVLKLSFCEAITETYETREVTVMAVFQRADTYGTSDVQYDNIVMPDTLFQSVYPNYRERISAIQIDTKGDLNEQQMDVLMDLVEQEHNVQIMVDSRYEDEIYYVHQKKSITILGFFLALVLGIIGLSNVVNTLVTDIYAHRQEVLIFQAVGMTKKQLWQQLFKKNFLLCLISSGIIVLAGRCITEFTAGSSTFTGFHENLFWTSFLLLILLMLGLCVLLASVMMRRLNRKSVVERLKDME